VRSEGDSGGLTALRAEAGLVGVDRKFDLDPLVVACASSNAFTPPVPMGRSALPVGFLSTTSSGTAVALRCILASAPAVGAEEREEARRVGEWLTDVWWWRRSGEGHEASWFSFHMSSSLSIDRRLLALDSRS